MNYEEMSDFEINGRVGKVVFNLEGESFRTTNPMNNVVEFITGFGDDRNFQYFDGCNKPSDAWPIIVENELSLWKTIDEWDASSCNGNIQHSDKKPLRAAMICFLKIKDAEK